MHKLKSQEYLAKINETFQQLEEPAHEIEIDTLLGYIRIFYSSVKAIPTNGITIPHHEVITTQQSINYHPESIDNPTQPQPIVETVTSPAIDQQIPSSEDKKEVESTIQQEAIQVKPLETVQPQPVIEKSETEILVGSPVQEEVVTVDLQSPEIAEETPINTSTSMNDTSPIIEDVVLEEETIAIPITPILNTDTKVVPVISHSEESTSSSILSKIEASQEKSIYKADSEKQFENSDAIQAIFSDKSPTGLVDFLGLSPLSDLNKAWGLNEKILVIKDLFGDDSSKFNQTVEIINKLSTFEEAKSYLIQNVVMQYEWNDLSKFKKASEFVKQVKRLFVK